MLLAPMAQAGARAPKWQQEAAQQYGNAKTYAHCHPIANEHSSGIDTTGFAAFFGATALMVVFLAAMVRPCPLVIFRPMLLDGY